MKSFGFVFMLIFISTWILYAACYALHGFYQKKILDIPWKNNYLDNVRRKISEKLWIKKSGTLEKRFPDAVVLGIKKCGTIALGSILQLHPEVAATAGDMLHISFFEKDRHYKKGMEFFKVKRLKKCEFIKTTFK